ncbi:LuxR family transcriptional regulator [Agrobacterium tumefaciens]|uniref:helix-turn-helix transcriptional regulator n=1 Tax=Agrobacterium tumefaciens TaxID=358 RepID=UPI00287EC29D|nr:LuxR family transcriptional regulator [Agrobacterium tumefaciens]MDS7598465.1 LuxR family transcriptional regulator [Agrobacterium tumefaciens]
MGEAQLQKLSWSISALREADSKPEFESRIAGIRDVYGFSHLTFLSVEMSTLGRGYLSYSTTYPEEWTSRYIERRYVRIDPVVEIYRSGFQPVDWSSLDRASDHTRKFFNEALDMGIGPSGMTVPVRGSSGSRSLVSATSAVFGQEWSDLRTSTKHDLMLLSHYMHEQFQTVTGAHAQTCRDLSRREKECLQLLARGITPKRIAFALQLSERTVRLYLGSARRKLGAATTYQAIARASFFELIEI